MEEIIMSYLLSLSEMEIEDLEIKKISLNEIFPLKRGHLIDHSWAGQLGNKIFYNFITDNGVFSYRSYNKEYSENGKYAGVEYPQPFDYWLQTETFNQIYGFLVVEMENYSYEESFRETRTLFVLDSPVSKTEIKEMFMKFKRAIVEEKLSETKRTS